MSFISYAQNFEDVMLWRALKHVDKGFYVDVGANDPNDDSVTKAFYDRGWHGINIEPVEHWHSKLLQERPHDINLKMAAGTLKGELDFYDIPDTGLSTFDESFAKKHEREKGYKIRKLKVPVDTLTAIIGQYGAETIHFLKIDVEGAEKTVLQGLDLHKIRPWIILLESNLPSSTIEVYEEWEDILLTANYSLAYVDGLNRFYVSEEKAMIQDAFRYPPNVFDRFILKQQFESMLLLQQAKEKVSVAQAEVKEAEADSFRANERLDKALALTSEAKMRADQAEAKIKEIEEKNIRNNELIEQLRIEIFEKRQGSDYKLSEAKQFDIHSDELNHSNHNWWIVADALNQELHSVYHSRSWRITWPLRKLMQLIKWLLLQLEKFIATFMRAIRWLIRGSIAWLTLKPGSRPRRTARLILIELRNWVLQHPKLKNKILLLLQHFPQLRSRIKNLQKDNPTQMTYMSTRFVKNRQSSEFDSFSPDNEVQDLTPRARNIYSDLQLAVAKYREGVR